VGQIFEQVPRLAWSPDELRAHRRAALQATLAFAAEHSTWHSSRLARLDLSALDPDDLGALPTMAKADLMAHWDDVVTDPRLTLDAARAHLERVDREGLSLLLDEYLVFQSGGSTGTPGIFCWHKDEMARWAGSTQRWSAAAGFGPPARGAWVGARSMRHPSAAVTIMSGNDPRLVVPVDQPVAAVVEQLNELAPDALSVVGSMLPALVEAARRGDLVINPGRIGVFGDVVDRGAMAAAEEVFGVAPTEGYPTTDVGHIGQQAPGEAGLYVNEDMLVVECVDEDDRPVPAGELSDHLLVTSLHQRTLPLIRYRIDDRVAIDPFPGTTAPAYRRIARIDGRSDDVFRYGGLTVHPHTFRSALCRHLAIVDHEVRQTADGVRVRVVAVSDVDVDQLAAELTAALVRAGLPQPCVAVEVVSDLPRTAVGKRRHFVPA
jgi:phenylacetate-coenzyme A ligase PaaK-like adenylate-forming protein